MHDLTSLIVVIDQENSCPYIEGQIARMPLEMSSVPLKSTEVDHLLARGYRRSGIFYYHTQCPACQACEPLRLDVNRFIETKSMKRVRRRGDQELEIRIGSPLSDNRRVQLFNRHRCERGLARSSELASEGDYVSFLVESAIDVWELSFWHGDQLVAVSITDVGFQALSAVYCFFDPDYEHLSLGTYAILTQISLAKQTGRRWLYLGMYVASNPHLNYKARYVPHQRFQNQCWVDYPTAKGTVRD